MLHDNTITGMSKTTMATGVGVRITEEEFEKEKDKEQGPTKIKAADFVILFLGWFVVLVLVLLQLDVTCSTIPSATIPSADARPVLI